MALGPWRIFSGLVRQDLGQRSRTFVSRSQKDRLDLMAGMWARTSGIRKEQITLDGHEIQSTEGNTELSEEEQRYLLLKISEILGIGSCNGSSIDSLSKKILKKQLNSPDGEDKIL